MADFLANPNFLTLLLIIIFVGGLGGFAALYLDPTLKDQPISRRAHFRATLLGVLAAATVPLFLSTLKSDLIKSGMTANDLLIFIGFCVILSLFADRFLNSLGDSILKRLKNAEQAAEEAKAQAENADAKAEEAAGAVTDLNKPTDPNAAAAGQTTEPTETDDPATTTEDEMKPSSENESFTLDGETEKGDSKSVKAAPSKKKTSKTAKSPRDMVWDALRDPNSRLRTVGSLAEQTGQSESVVADWLLQMERDGKAKRIVMSGGKDIWRAI